MHIQAVSPLFKTHPILKKSLLLFILGFISAFSFAPYFIFPILVVGLSLLMYVINKAQTKKQIALFAFSFGAGLGMSSLSWISHALLIDEGHFVFFIPFVLLGLGSFLGLFFMVPALAASFTKPGIYRWLSFAGWFTLFEWIRSWFLTGFPWNLTGYIWADFPPMIQIASVVGTYGLSLITLLAFTSFALWPKKNFIYTSIAILFLCYAGGSLRIYEGAHDFVWGVKLRLVQPNIAQTLKWDPQKADENFSKLLALSRYNNEEITHVIWPESAVPFLLEKNETERLRLMSAVRQGGTLITGALRVVDMSQKQLANSIFIVDDLAHIKGYYDKSHLVPFGEYVPLRGILPFDKIVPINSDFVSGKGPETIFIPKAPSASMLVCYEAIFPHEIINPKKRPGWILNVTNDAWYGLSAGPYQHLAITQLRAVEEGLPLIRATNNGISAIINPYGQIISSLALNTEGVLDSSLPRPLPRTIYARFGNSLPLGLALLCILISFLGYRKIRE